MMIKVDWDSLQAVECKLRQATSESEKLKDAIERANLTDTLCKLGSFLDATFLLTPGKPRAYPRKYT